MLGVSYVRALHRLQRPLSRSLCCVSERVEILVLSFSLPLIPSFSHIPTYPSPKTICLGCRGAGIYLHLKQSQESQVPSFCHWEHGFCGVCIAICEAMRNAERGRALFMARGTISFLTERKGKGNNDGMGNGKRFAISRLTPVSVFNESL